MKHWNLCNFCNYIDCFGLQPEPDRARFLAVLTHNWIESIVKLIKLGSHWSFWARIYFNLTLQNKQKEGKSPNFQLLSVYLNKPVAKKLKHDTLHLFITVSIYTSTDVLIFFRGCHKSLLQK